MKIDYHSIRDHLKISKIGTRLLEMFEMFQYVENIGLKTLQIFNIFVSRAEN